MNMFKSAYMSVTMSIPIYLIDSIFIIYEFCMCKFAYLLNLFVTPKSVLVAVLWLLMDMHRMVKTLSHSTHTFPAEVQQSDVLPTCFSHHSINKCLFHCHVFGVFFWGGVFLWFLLVILMLKMAPKKTVEVLSDVLKCKEIVMYLMKKKVCLISII